MYATVDDAQMRLSGSVIRIEGEPCYITEVTHEEKLNYIRLKDGSQDTISYKRGAKSIDVTPLPLGYLNEEEDVVLMQRVPCRKWKQGLHSNNHTRSYMTREEERERRHREYLVSPALHRCVMNEYPTFEQARQMVGNKEFSSRAFNRRYALQRDKLGLIWLWYRGDKVGWLENGLPVLSDNYLYLQEELQEVIHAGS